MTPEDNQELMKQLGLSGPPTPSYSDLLAASVPPPDASAAAPATDGTDVLPATGPKYADETLADPRAMHEPAPVTSSAVDSSIPSVPLGSPAPVTASAPGSLIPTVSEPNSDDEEERPFNIPSPSPRRGLMQNTQNEIAANQAELERQRATGSGVSQIHNPFLRALARIADVAGTIIAPGVATLVPGTSLHHMYTENRQQGLIDSSMENLRSLTGADKDEAEAAHERAEAEGKDTTGKTPEELTLHDLMTGDNGAPKINPDTKKPYTYLEAYSAINQAKADTKPGKEDAKLMAETSYPPAAANAALTARYQIMNPGKPLPPELTLSDKSTVGDYKRIEDDLTKYINTQGTKAQRDAANEARKNAEEDRQLRQEDKEFNEGQKMVQGFEPGTGRQVLASRKVAKELNLEDTMEAPTADSSKSLAARHFLPLVYRNSKADPGILQIIRKLDRDGKLGVIASRWNDFLAGKVGADDTDQQYFERLRTRLGLSKTLLMNLHVGNRGGAYMFEHFEDLANEKRMNAKTLRAGVEEEFKYALDRAMLPGSRMGPYRAFTGENSLGVDETPAQEAPPAAPAPKAGKRGRVDPNASVKPIGGAYIPGPNDPAIGAVEDGYRYNGKGPRNDPKSWEPVQKGKQ